MARYGWKHGKVRLKPDTTPHGDCRHDAARGLLSRYGMNSQRPPLDTDPSDMTDFEKNATLGELEQIVEEPETDEVVNRERQERGNRGPQQEPGFGQGA